MVTQQNQRASLAGKLLVAMPFMVDPRFKHSVIFVCGHDDKGAMGIVLNKVLSTITFTELLEQVDLKVPSGIPSLPVHYGGPVEMGRGFVLHTPDYLHEATVLIPGGFAITATLDILAAIAIGKGPSKAILALGYAGWSAGQLEYEIQNNSWLTVDPTYDLVFENDLDQKWTQAYTALGIHPSTLSYEFGHA
ncbi:MAG: YqgE/AlgH family protein [Proteobacteria bacterium]|nr:YqgE/AlgH family protein [Pseudomonadota bacterium]